MAKAKPKKPRCFFCHRIMASESIVGDCCTEELAKHDAEVEAIVESVQSGHVVDDELSMLVDDLIKTRTATPDLSREILLIGRAIQSRLNIRQCAEKLAAMIVENPEGAARLRDALIRPILDKGNA